MLCFMCLHVWTCVRYNVFVFGSWAWGLGCPLCRYRRKGIRIEGSRVEKNISVSVSMSNEISGDIGRETHIFIPDLYLSPLLRVLLKEFCKADSAEAQKTRTTDMHHGQNTRINIVRYYYRAINKKLSWCWQTRATRLEVSQGHQTLYHSIC